MNTPIQALASVWLIMASTALALGDDLLQEVQKAHRSSVESLRTFSCDVQLEWKGPRKSWTESGKYRRSGHLVRIQQDLAEESSDVVVQNGIVTGLYRRKGSHGATYVSASTGPSKSIISCDAWLRAMLTFFEPDAGSLSFDELLARSQTNARARRCMDNGRSLIEVDVTTRLSRYQIWFDPEVNFLVRKLVGSITEADGRVYKGECLVHRFMELAPGLYFPEGVGNLEEGVELTASFTNVLANRPIGAEAFRLSFPPGIVMTDFVRGSVYRVDPDGRDIGPVLDARGKPITLTSAIQLPSVGSPGAFNGPTVEEPTSWTVWLLPASLGLLLVSLALWIGRRWRASHG